MSYSSAKSSFTYKRICRVCVTYRWKNLSPALMHALNCLLWTFALVLLSKMLFDVLSQFSFPTNLTFYVLVAGLSMSRKALLVGEWFHATQFSTICLYWVQLNYSKLKFEINTWISWIKQSKFRVNKNVRNKPWKSSCFCSRDAYLNTFLHPSFGQTNCFWHSTSGATLSSWNSFKCLFTLDTYADSWLQLSIGHLNTIPWCWRRWRVKWSLLL